MAGGIQLAPLLTQMKVDIKTFKSDMDKVKTEAVGKAKEVSKSMTNAAKVGKTMSDFGGKMTKAITLPIVGAGAAAAKFSMDFGDSLAKVSTIADTTKVPIGVLKKGVLDLSDKTGMAATELNEGLYQAISASVDTADAVDFLGVAVKAAKGGFTDTATAVDGLTTVLNSYGMEASNADKIANQMLITQNEGKTSFGELASAVGKVTPIAASLGVTTEELFSSLASTTAQGLATSESVTALKAAMSNIVKPSKEASDAAEMLGIKFSASEVKAKGWMPFLQDLKKKLSQASPEFAKMSEQMSKNAKKINELEKAGKKSSKEYKELSKANKGLTKDMKLMAKASDSPLSAFATMFGSVEGLNSILMLTSENGATKYNKSMEQMKTNTTALNDAFNKMDKAPGQEMKKAMNDIKNLGIEVGDILMPVIRDVMKSVRGMAQGFKNLSPHTKKAIVKTALFAATMGPVLSVTGKTITAFTKLTPVIRGATVAFKGGTPIVKTFVKTLLSGKGSSEAFSLAMKEGTPLIGKFLGKLGLTKTVGAGATKALIGVEGAAGAAAGATGVGGLLSSLGGLAIAAAPWVATAAVVGGAAYGIHKVLSKEVVPSVDLYADKIETVTKVENGMVVTTQETTAKLSKETKKRVETWKGMEDGISKSLFDIQIKSSNMSKVTRQSVVGEYNLMVHNLQGVSQEMKDKVIKEVDEMTKGGTVLTGDMTAKMEEKLNGLLSSGKGISEEYKSQMLQNWKQTYDGMGLMTQQGLDNIKGQFRQQKDYVVKQEDERHNELLGKVEQFNARYGSLDKEAKQALLDAENHAHNTRKQSLESTNVAIENIMNEEYQKHGTITEEGMKRINQLREQGYSDQIGALTRSEEEELLLQENFNRYKESMTVENAQKLIQESNKVTENKIKAAEKQREEDIKLLDSLRRTGKMSDEEYKKNVEAVNKKTQDIIDKAKEEQQGIQEQISQARPGIEKEIELTTGRSKDIWDNLWTDLKGVFSNILNGAKNALSASGEAQVENAKFGLPRNMHYNGLSYVPVDGYVARLHKGERVLTADENRDYTQGNTGNKGISVTNNFYGRVDSPYEITRASKKAWKDMSFA